MAEGLEFQWREVGVVEEVVEAGVEEEGGGMEIGAGTETGAEPGVVAGHRDEKHPHVRYLPPLTILKMDTQSVCLAKSLKYLFINVQNF